MKQKKVDEIVGNKLKNKKTFASVTGSMIRYCRDYRFKSILIKYFLLLFVGIVLPISALNVYYSKRNQNIIFQEMTTNNEVSLEKAYNNMNTILTSVKNMSYSLGQMDSVHYLATLHSANDNLTTLKMLSSTISSLQITNSFIDSIYIYLSNTGEVISKSGVQPVMVMSDRNWMEYTDELTTNRTSIIIRRKNNGYPYLISILYPIASQNNNYRIGTVVINMDIEKLGSYMGSGRYRNKEEAPMLLIFDQNMDKLFYSDEYRLLENEQEDLQELHSLKNKEEEFSDMMTLWNTNYIVSGKCSKTDGLYYLFFSNIEQYEKKQQQADIIQRMVMIFSICACIVLAVFLAVWIYRPIQQTVKLLDDMSMLTAWDKKQNLDEMKAIQRSILAIKKEKDSLNQQIETRMISLHNAQICALQSQINPHFMYNTLESIGNAAAMLTKEKNGRL